MSTQPQHANDKKPNTPPVNGSATKPATTTPATTAASAAAASTTPAADSTAATAEKQRNASKVYIVVGTVKEFKNSAEAEKFLNTDTSAPAEFHVIKGHKIEKKTKLSLR